MTTALILLSEWEASQVEFWMPVKGFPGYDVSNKGHVRSYWVRKTRKGRTGLYSEIGPEPHVLKPFLNEYGYYRVVLPLKGTRKTCFVSRLVAFAFLPQPEGRKEANHITGLTTDNRLGNIEWATKSENIRHADRIGLRVMPGGMDRLQRFKPRCDQKLDVDKVKEIRRRIKAGEMQKHIAKDFGVKQQAISKIATGQRWGYIEGE